MPDDKTSPGSRAVFLSYSREDADPARRIADALRAFGLEVWFDQNELRGGDSWDAKIKRQIRECALFMPVISSHTQSRMEGYFRREWKLGVERTHDMAGGLAFITPVVIDETPESAALVPEEFMRYQWTRLPHGVPTPEFVGQVKKLLEAPGHTVAPAGSRPPISSSGAGTQATQGRTGLPGRVWGALVAGFVGAAVAIYVSRKPAEPAPAAPAAVEAKVPAVVPATNDKSVAVLPFDNMSEEKDSSAFFADGVQEDILTNLSFIKDLRVVSRTSVMQYRNTVKPIRQIAQELGVTYVLEGSVRRAGNKVRVTGQLIHAATDEHVWAKAYDRDITDVFAIQAELSQSIADSLQAAISPAEHTLIDRKPTSNPAAYDFYLKARASYELNDINAPEQAKWLLDAVQLDPGFAQAWALLAALRASNQFSDIDATAEQMEQAKAAIETAVKLAPDDPVVIEMRGDYFYYGYRDYKSAAEQYRRLQELRPNSPEAIGSLGLIYRRLGRWDDSLASLRKSIELDPQNQRYRSTIVQHLLGVRRYAEAKVVSRRVAEMTEGTVTTIVWKASDLFIPYLESGSMDAETRYVAKLKSEKPDDHMVVYLRRIWARSTGDYAEAVSIDSNNAYYDEQGIPHWQQDLDAAFDYIAAGDAASGKGRLEKLLPQLKAKLVDEPKNSGLWGAYGRTEAFLGDRVQALAAANKVVELVPESLDAVDGPLRSATRAKILAWVGEKDQAIAEFSRLLHVPYGVNVYGDRYDAGWLPLRGDHRFQALLADPKNNEPIY